jgi:hypothetical protein
VLATAELRVLDTTKSALAYSNLSHQRGRLCQSAVSKATTAITTPKAVTAVDSANSRVSGPLETTAVSARQVDERVAVVGRAQIAE